MTSTSKGLAKPVYLCEACTAMDAPQNNNRFMCLVFANNILLLLFEAFWGMHFLALPPLDFNASIWNSCYANKLTNNFFETKKSSKI